LTESPYADDQEKVIASLVDVVFTNERTSMATFADLCHEVHYYQHAHDPAQHYVESEPNEEADGIPCRHDVVFVGTGFEERCDLLAAVNWEGIDLGLYGAWGLLGSRSKLRKYVRGGITPNDQAARLYRNAKIGLNLHRTSIGYGRGVAHVKNAESINPRCYELAATGTFTVTDARAEVAEVFGGAMPTFDSPQRLEAIIRHYLAHEDERRRLAALLPGLVAPHVFDDRAARILDILNRKNYRLGG
jgi:spore maturation protein CgeB